jgi:tRNA1(Val) A37 N6-methylase TrmN6
MATKMGISENDLILEPSAGEGIFIDEILKSKIPVKIDALDIDKKAIDVLNVKYSNNPNIRVKLTDTLFDEELDEYTVSELWLKNTDTLLDEQLDFFNLTGGHYDKVIGNPPYGAWQDYDKRDLLKKKYVGQYVKETYTLFLLRSISVLKNGGRLSFIVPDTFLFLNMHEKLRKILLTSTKIEEILIFPSKFFPGVSFGYSNLSIITLEKCDRDDTLNNVVKIIKGFQSSKEFADIIREEYPEHLNVFELKQLDVFSAEKSRFILAENDAASMIGHTEKKLGDVADIVTGFYSGNNKKFICAFDSSVKGAKNYPIIDFSKVFDSMSLTGIDNTEEGYVPYIKSSSPYRYKRLKDEWYVRWDKGTVKFYNEDKKARFQNSQFYFKTGVAIPMVKSSEIRATIMEKRVFDQSIVGIFPKDKADLYYILALMNSEVINQLIHAINPTANNSSNYVKQIPYIEPSEKDRKRINKTVDEILSLNPEEDKDKISQLHQYINNIIDSVYASEK